MSAISLSLLHPRLQGIHYAPGIALVKLVQQHEAYPGGGAGGGRGARAARRAGPGQTGSKEDGWRGGLAPERKGKGQGARGPVKQGIVTRYTA